MASESNSAIAVIHKITCEGGDTFNRVFRYWLDLAKTQPNPLAGSTFELKVYDEKRKSIILLFTMADGIAITGTNELTITKTKDQMKLRAGIYFYKLEKTTGATCLSIMKGDFEIKFDV